MKILYSIQGTGNGHISRARHLAHHLNKSTADTTYMFTGRPRDHFVEMEVFGDFWYRPGLSFVSQAGQLDYWQTYRQNQLTQFMKDVATLPVQQFDLIISDFEPVSAWAGKLKGVPVLGCGHQYAFSENTPLAGDNWLSRKIMQHFAPADFAVGQHWFPYEYNVLPPIIDSTLKPKEKSGKYLVYLPFEDQQKVLAILNQIKGHQFIQYSSELMPQSRGNVEQKTACVHGFKQDLMAAEGVICNSGFELNSECIHLGLPILTKPLSGQMEQASNALALEQLELGSILETLEPQTITSWLNKEKTRSAKPWPDVAKALSEWILNGQWHDVQDLARSLWSNQYQPPTPPILSDTIDTANASRVISA